MAQDFTLPASSNSIKAILAAVNDSLEALVTLHSGSSAPSSPHDYQLWADTANGLLKLYNPGGASWVTVGPLLLNGAIRSLPLLLNAGLSATTTLFLPAPPWACVVSSISVVSDSATTSDGSNNWSFNLTNLTQTEELFATDPNTNTDGDIAVDTEYVLSPDQNAEIAAGDVLELVITKTGTPGDLTLCRIDANLYPKG